MIFRCSNQIGETLVFWGFGILFRLLKHINGLHCSSGHLTLNIYLSSWRFWGAGSVTFTKPLTAFSRKRYFARQLKGHNPSNVSNQQTQSPSTGVKYVGAVNLPRQVLRRTMSEVTLLSSARGWLWCATQLWEGLGQDRPSRTHGKG